MLEENKNCWLYNECNHIDCEKVCLRRLKLDYLYSQALISLNQRKHINLRIDADNSDLNAFTTLNNISKDIVQKVSQGINICIHSTICGNGKTSWALRLIEEYFNQIWLTSRLECRALFINVPKFLLEIKSNITEQSDYVKHIKDNILKADIVVWDDIGTKLATSFEHEHLLSLIDSRLSTGKTNIYTSNLSSDELHNVLGDRLASRIINMSVDIIFVGSDKRGLCK